MTRRQPSHLRLHVEDNTTIQKAPRKVELQDEVAACLKAFVHATGWAIRSTAPKSYSSDGGSSSSPTGISKMSTLTDHQNSESTPPESSPHFGKRNPGLNGRDRQLGQPRWRVVDGSPMDGILSADDLAHFPTVTLEHAESLLAAIESLVDRLESSEDAIRRQEAELATGVSVSRAPNEQQELADRIEAILASSSRSIGAVAAAVYLLDETTSTLKMRSCIGLPTARLTQPARDLRGSLADLEALMGNAVALEDTRSMPEWPTPEKFDSALVVPIGSASMPHGTIWFWSEQPRKHSLMEIEVANLAAGRVMSELEKTLLGTEVKQAKQIRQQLDAAGSAQAARLPDSQPLHRDFEISGWTFQDGALGGGFHDWDMTPNEWIVALVGSAAMNGPHGALIATTVQSAIRTLWPSGQSPSHILSNTAVVLAGADECESSASSALLQLNPETGYGSLANAGSVQTFIISHRGFRPIGSIAPRLAAQLDATYTNHRFILQPGEILVSFSDTVVNGVGRSMDKQNANRRSICKTLGQNELLQSVRELMSSSANEIAAHLARMLPTLAPLKNSLCDRSLIVIKNRKTG